MTPLEFETSQAARWSEFERCLHKAAKGREQELNSERFLDLFRMCCEHLALAQARGFPAHIVERLSAATAQGHQIVYRQSDLGIARIARVLLRRFPEQVRAHRSYLLAASMLLLAPTLAVGMATYLQPDLIRSLVDSRTAEAFEHMYAPSAQSIGRIRDTDSDWMMFGYYIMNNIGIAFQSYVTGVAFGIGSVVFMLYNGAFAGAVAGYVTALGLGGTFFPFVVTHSAFELTAIVLCGAAGLRLGRSVLLPGREPRLLSLQIAARETSVIVFGATAMLVIAAGIEAFWSSAAWVEPRAKYFCAAACWSLVILFFARRPHAG